MCGISGFHLKNEIIHNKYAIERKLSNIQSHRGPDFIGTYVDQKYNFYHNRLSLIDGSVNGNQPFVIGEHVLCFNGEIYNYKKLKTKITNHSFVSNSDTEVLLTYIKEFGIEKTLTDINGMFAFSYYNTTTKELILARDRFGIKPLYYSNTENHFAFASEARTIAKTFGIKPNSYRTIASINSSAEGSPKLSMFDNVYQVKPGTYLKIGSNFSIQENTYFEFKNSISKEKFNDLNKKSEKEVLFIFEKLMQTSTEEMLNSDFDMGCFVSGGIDSSLISSISKGIRPDIQLFTTDVVGNFSEYEKSKSLASYLNLPLHKTEFKKEDFLSNWVEATEHNGAPIIYFTNGIPIAKVAELARNHEVKGVLTGEGSDELFLGYSTLMAKRYKNIALFPINFVKQLYKTNRSVYKYLFPDSKNDLNVFGNNLSHGFREQTLLKDGNEIYSFVNVKERKYYADSFEMIQKHLHGLLHRNDRMGMIHSIEVRFPFLHEDIVDFALSLPLKYKTKLTSRLHNMKHPFITDKWIVRELSKKYLPKSLVVQKKNGLPINGLNGLKIKSAFFENGYVAELLQLDSKTLQYIIEKENPYFVGKLASIEIFGMLYDLGYNHEEINSKIFEHISY